MHTTLRQLRKFAGLTQAQLAAKAGLYQQDISRWERGQVRPGMSSLVKLTKALGVSVSQLVLGNSRWPVHEYRVSTRRF